jgi:large subunit ribosomal protein L14
MKGISAESVRSTNYGTVFECSDNTGAKVVYLITVFGQKTRKRQIPSAGIGDMINVVVKKGKPDMRKKIFRAVIIRTRKGLRRSNGLRVKFDTNAVVITDKEGLPKGSEVKGCVPKEVGERYPKIVGSAAVIV